MSAQIPQPPRNRAQAMREAEVKNLPPPWKRAASEAGNPRAPNSIDAWAVIVFALGLIAILAWYVASGMGLW